MEPNPYLVASSLTFIIPTTLAAYNQQWLHYSILLNLMLMSSLYHATKNITLFYLDQVACFALTASTIRLSLINNHYTVPITTIGYTIGTYYGGYMYNTFIWSPDKSVATFYHVIMHIVINFAVSYVIT